MTRKKVDAAHPSPGFSGEEPSGPDVMGDYLADGWQVDDTEVRLFEDGSLHLGGHHVIRADDDVDEVAAVLRRWLAS